MSLFTKIVDRSFAVAGAIVFLQAPQFIQDYKQHLAGHLSEVSWQLDQLRHMTKMTGRTLEALVDKFIHNSDNDVVFQGNLIETLIKRELSFKEALNALSQANPFTKPYLFVKYGEWDLILETTKNFKAGLPLTLEGILWALIGLFLGYGLFRLLIKISIAFKKLFST